MTTAFISHPDCVKHVMSDYHPESPARLGVIDDALIEGRLSALLAHIDAPKVDISKLQPIHTKKHIDYILESAPASGLFSIDGDTTMNPHTLEAALRAAGANTHAVDLVMQGKAKSAFCSVRPPGHHAERSLAMGFCFFNNIAVAASHALTCDGVDRVAIIDFDVHHGNGTEDIFKDDDRVMLCSSFQSPCFPGMDYIRDSERVLNSPLSPGSGSQEFRQIATNLWGPGLKQFKPDFIFVSAGFDAHFLDPLADLRLQTSDYEWISGQIVQWASELCEGRIVSSLEGGYNLECLGPSVAAYLKPML
jgi:acetoin utilization deacetylase AcuC-like enzyme